MNIYFVRHAETLLNQKGRCFSGAGETDLSAKGIKQAKKVGKSNLWGKIDAVYVSTLKRTIDTARYILGDRKIEYISVKEFSEMDFGIYEGRVLDESTKNDPIFFMWENNPENLTFPGGENVTEHANAAFNKFLEIIQNTDCQNILIVSHKTLIRTLLVQIMNLEMNAIHSIPCSNSAITKVSFNNNRFSIEYINAPINQNL